MFDVHHRKLRRVKIDKARQEIQDKKELDEAKLEFAEKLKRKLAIQAMLNTMNVRFFIQCCCQSLFNICLIGTFYLYRKRRIRLNWQWRKRRQPGESRLAKLMFYVNIRR